MGRGWFVAGTDTGVGKTRAACALLAAAVQAGRRAVGMKPVASGCRATPVGLRSDDALALIEAANVVADYADVNPYTFEPAVAPHLAARDLGVIIRLDVIRASFAQLATRADYIVVEGAGGWMTPISEEHTMAAVASVLELPVVLVVGMRLGCLNQALLSQAAIEKSGLVFAGWIANLIDPAMQRVDDNVATLEKSLNAPLLAVFPHTVQALSLPIVGKLTKWIVNSD